jgi:hypothetical protein
MPIPRVSWPGWARLGLALGVALLVGVGLLVAAPPSAASPRGSSWAPLSSSAPRTSEPAIVEQAAPAPAPVSPPAADAVSEESVPKADAAPRRRAARQEQDPEPEPEDPCLLADSEGCVFHQSQCGIFGTDGNDLLVGTPGPDFICGGAGDDTIEGGEGTDTILGGPGLDDISGGGGSDCLVVDELSELRDDPTAPPGDRVVPQQPSPGADIDMDNGECSYDVDPGNVRPPPAGPPPDTPPPAGGIDDDGGLPPSPSPGGESQGGAAAPVESPVQAGSLYLALTDLLADDEGEPAADVTVSSARLEGRKITLLLVCTGSTTGKLELVVPRTHGRARVELGSAEFDCSGDTAVAKVVLSRRNARLLNRLGDVRLKVTIDFRDSAGQRGRGHDRVALRR